MKTKLVLLTLLSAFSLQPSALLAQGSLTPPGAPAPTFKTLAQIEPRTPISSVPYNIATSGSYYLTTNLTVSSGDAIYISANGVTLDLNGFTIASTAPSAAGTGIFISVGRRNLTILNGFIQGGVTNNGSGVFHGSGFGSSIYAAGTLQNVRVSGVSVAGCLDSGIYLGLGDSSVVESCTVQTVGGYGIVASTIKASVAKDCGNHAVYGNQVADCQGESSSGYGVYATTAMNCYGSSTNGSGLQVKTAQNCYGFSGSSIGLYADTAQNCYGISTSGKGLVAGWIAIGCFGYSSSGTGLNAYSANSCRGTSSSGTGLAATYGNFCFGSSVSVVTRYNMP